MFYCSSQCVTHDQLKRDIYVNEHKYACKNWSTDRDFSRHGFSFSKHVRVSRHVFRLWSRSPKCRPISARHSCEPPPPDEDLRRWNAAPDAGWRRAHDLTPRSLAIYSPITRLRARPRAHLLRKCHINAHRRARGGPAGRISHCFLPPGETSTLPTRRVASASDLQQITLS